MKTLFSKNNLPWFLLFLILCGAVAVVWPLVVNDAPPANAVRIDGAGTGRAGKGNLDTQAGALSSARPTATQNSLGIGSGKSAGISGGSGQGAMAQETPRTILGAPTPTTVLVTIYISGAVAKPGVYTLAEGARVQDAISAAGGALIEADLDGINLAQRLTDEAHIIIGRRDEGTPSSLQQPAAGINSVPGAPVEGGAISQPAGAKPTPSAPININTATAALLQTLPGVGPSLAARIVTDRDQNGPFSSIEDLTRVTGIKEGILSKIREYITVGQ